MNKKRKVNPLSVCKVTGTKLSLRQISRLIVNPFFISSKCGRCRQLCHYGPKCTTCSVCYHPDCALLRGMCCGLPIFLLDPNSLKSTCRKCATVVQFGPYCTLCRSKFHSSCLSPFDQCCLVTIGEAPSLRQCGRCEEAVILGPKCPICKKVYHANCVDKAFTCCGVQLYINDEKKYRCGRCKKNISLGCPLCLICGRLYHGSCLKVVCCGMQVQLETLYIPSFKFTVDFILRSKKRKSERLINLPQTVQNYSLRNQRVKKRNSSCQTNGVDSIAIINVKSEIEDVDESDEPPVLERETDFVPEPALPVLRPDNSAESEESLKNLFDFLYNMVKKFPPQLQTQVKIDLFKTVTEAEMRARYNLVETQNGAK